MSHLFQSLKEQQLPGVFFDNQRSTFAFPSEFVGSVTQVVAGIKEFYVTEKTKTISFYDSDNLSCLKWSFCTEEKQIMLGK